ncbi:MAG: DNA primase [Rickettsiales bacterium]
MRFSPSLIERLRSHFLMSEVIARRMPIKKHGREYHGLCPFHNEKSPSFTVNDEKGFFHCFGCGAHGDSIEFIRRFERLSYPEAIENLAREAGIEIAKSSPEERRKVEQEKTLYDVLEVACQWFEKQLLAPAGMLAKDYIENRGVRAETARQFRIGYAPEERAELHQYLTKAGFPQAMQAEAGLISISEAGRVYDRFRGRAIFPIRNASGRVVAFGGRLMASGKENKSLPKYLNSPETPLFKKGEILYNLDQAKRPARDGNMVVVMEGYMDVVMSAQAGIGYCVATLGTAVTPEHLRLLWQLAKEPILCLDGDTAGNRAMLRASEAALPLLKPSYSLRYAILPQDEDPDSYVQKQGKASFEKILLSSRRLSQILWDVLASQYKLDLPEGRAALDDASQKLAAKITDTTVRQHYLTHFRNQLRTQSTSIKYPDKKQSGKTSPRQKLEGNQAQTRSPHIEHMVVQHHSAALESLTQRLLNILVQFPKLLHKSNVDEALSRLDIRSTQMNALRNSLLSASTHTDIDNRELFESYIRNQLNIEHDSPLFAENSKPTYRENLTEQDAALVWNETVATYEIAHLEYEFKELQERISQSMNETDYNRMIELQNAVIAARARRSFAPAEEDVA